MSQEGEKEKISYVQLARTSDMKLAGNSSDLTVLTSDVQLVAIHQALEKIIILQSSLYSFSVHTYCVDGQLPNIKQITQATGDLQAI